VGLFDQAIGLDDQFAEAHAARADAFLALLQYGGPDIDREEALSAITFSTDAALAIDPQLARAFGTKAAIAFGQGDREGAELWYQNAVGLDPDDALTNNDYWWLVFLQEGATKRTFELAENMLRTDPMAAGANENMGWQYFDDGQLDKALQQMEKAVDIDPNYALGHNALGVVQRSLSLPDRAIASSQRAYELNPADGGRILTGLYATYADIGRGEEALATLRDGGDIGLNAAVSYSMIGDVYREVLGQFDLAAASYEHAIDLRATPRFLAKLALVSLDMGDTGAAEQWASEAERLVEDRGLAESEMPRLRVQRRWALISRLNLSMHEGDYAAGEVASQELAGVGGPWGFFSLVMYQPYETLEPLGYFGLLTDNANDTLAFLAGAFPRLLEEPDPFVTGINLRAAIDLAAVLQETGEEARADLLLRKAEKFIDEQPEALLRNRYRTAPIEIYALQGRVDDALDAMRLAINNGWRAGWWRARHNPHLDILRDQLRFGAMMAELERLATQ